MPALSLPAGLAAELLGLLVEQAEAHHVARGAQKRAVYAPTEADTDAAWPAVEAAEARATTADRALVTFTRSHLTNPSALERWRVEAVRLIEAYGEARIDERRTGDNRHAAIMARRATVVALDDARDGLLRHLGLDAGGW